jgi:transporter family protein
MFEVWFLYALIFVIVSSFTIIVDKLMLENRLSPFSYYAAIALPGLAVSICVLLLFPTKSFSIPYAIAFVAGLLSACGYFFYAASIKKEEASRIAALTSLEPAFVAVLAVFLVNEIFPAKSYVGIGLMILGSVLISYKRNLVKKTIPLWLMLALIAANFFYGLDMTIAKVSLDQISVWSFIMMFIFGRSIVGFLGLAIPTKRRQFTSEIRELGRNYTLTFVSGIILWNLQLIFVFYAASLGPITLVSTTILLSPFFILLFTVLMTKYLPHVLKEEIDRSTVAMKLIAIVLIFAGTTLILA